jgi:hypothetical protein
MVISFPDRPMLLIAEEVGKSTCIIETTDKELKLGSLRTCPGPSAYIKRRNKYLTFSFHNTMPYQQGKEY